MNVIDYIELKRPEMEETLATLVRIPSVKGDPVEGKPYGMHVARALDEALSVAENLGLRARNVDGHMGVVELGEGDQTLGILVHVDVAEPGSGWSVEPFSAAVRDGIMISRGTADNKGPLVSALYALGAVRSGALPLNKKVQILIGCDEDNCRGNMRLYREKHRLPDVAFSPDGGAPLLNAQKAVLRADVKKNLRLKAGDIVSIKAGASTGRVPAKASAVVRCPLEQVQEAIDGVAALTRSTIEASRAKNGVRIDVQGKEAPACEPQEGNNALTALLMLLSRLPLQGEVADSLRVFAQSFTHNDYYGFNSFVDCSDDPSGRLTQNPATIELGTRCITLGADMRVPVTISPEEVLVRLAATFPGCSVTPRYIDAAHYVDEQSPYVQRLMRIYAEQTGEELRCEATGRDTYARALPGTVSFGCAAPGCEARIRMADEQYRLSDLALNARIMAAVIREFCCDEK